MCYAHKTIDKAFHFWAQIVESNVIVRLPTLLGYVVSTSGHKCLKVMGLLDFKTF